MNGKIFNGIGVALLLFCFAASIGRIIFMGAGTSPDGSRRTVIRFAHWQLEQGPREALDAIASEYMRLHPDVDVRQIAIPERIYSNWLITQLVGGTAPDIIQIRGDSDSDRLTRYFVPLGEVASEPNPYNQGTNLEGIPLRETFFDGMEGGYIPALAEYYGIPITASTLRVFYNRDLLEQITGSPKPPETYDDFLAVAHAVSAYAARTGKAIVPIAGSKLNAPILMERLFGSQTQKLMAEVLPPGLVGIDGVGGLHVAKANLENRWSVEDPAIRSGFEIMREVGSLMQPGFLQAQRDDAALMFAQGRALMIASGSWDATSIARQASFPLVIGRLPFPTVDDPRYGRFTRGPVTEAESVAGLAFGLTKESEHPEQALDFLRFLASQPTNRLWSEKSGWLPAVVDTPVSDEIRPFLPTADGYPAGFVSGIQRSIFPSLRRVIETNAFRLYASNAGVDDFIASIRGGYQPAIHESLKRSLPARQDRVRNADLQLAARAWIEGDSASVDRLRQAALRNDRAFYLQRSMVESPSSPNP